MIDMSMINEALQRRSGGGEAPMTDQMTATSGVTPTGGINTPTPVQGNIPTPTNTMGKGKKKDPFTQNSGIVKNLITATSPEYDEETRQISKALINKLLQQY